MCRFVSLSFKLGDSQFEAKFNKLFISVGYGLKIYFILCRVLIGYKNGPVLKYLSLVFEFSVSQMP